MAKFFALKFTLMITVLIASMGAFAAPNGGPNDFAAPITQDTAASPNTVGASNADCCIANTTGGPTVSARANVEPSTGAIPGRSGAHSGAE